MRHNFTIFCAAFFVISMLFVCSFGSRVEQHICVDVIQNAEIDNMRHISELSPKNPVIIFKTSPIIVSNDNYIKMDVPKDDYQMSVICADFDIFQKSGYSVQDLNKAFNTACYDNIRPYA